MGIQEFFSGKVRLCDQHEARSFWAPPFQYRNVFGSLCPKFLDFTVCEVDFFQLFIGFGAKPDIAGKTVWMPDSDHILIGFSDVINGGAGFQIEGLIAFCNVHVFLQPVPIQMELFHGFYASFLLISYMKTSTSATARYNSSGISMLRSSASNASTRSLSG
jgi:hypothetical protein